MPNEYELLGKHVAGASIFISNWQFWREVGYFNAEASLKPLLHLWSLAVEEQFYLVLPLFFWWRDVATGESHGCSAALQ